MAFVAILGSDMLPTLVQDKVRAGRPEEVVRLYDTLAALIVDLTDVATAMGGVGGETLLDSSAAQVLFFLPHQVHFHFHCRSILPSQTCTKAHLTALQIPIA